MQLLDRSFDVGTAPVADAPLDTPALRKVEQFLFQEARLLDERCFEQWLALWTEHGRYWVPRHHEQVNPFEQISLFWEDRVLRQTRVRRLMHARNWSQQPVTRSVHLVSNIQVDGLDRAGHLIVSSSLQITEYRLEQRQFAARVIHKLATTPDGHWRMQLKRINLVNADSVFSSLEIFL